MELNIVNTSEVKILEKKVSTIENKSIAENKAEEFSMGGLFDGLLKISRHFTNNYLKNYSGYQNDNRDIALTYNSFFTKLVIEPKEMSKIHSLELEFVKKQQILWNSIFIDQFIKKEDAEKEPVIAQKKGDNRFKAPYWVKYPNFKFLKQNQLLLEDLALQIVDEVEMVEPTRKRLDFYTKQYVELLSPENFFFTNPEAIELAFKTKGKSIWRGFNNFVRDIEKGRINQVDETAFEVGINLGMSPGTVILENELIQLIQYTPSTKNVKEIPLLIIPPWINKFYILDLKPEKSFIKYMVDQGNTVFIISWKNPAPGMGSFSFDDYVRLGALKAIEVAENISSTSKINVLGYCLGGTLLGVAAAILAEQKKDIINTITLLASMLEFSYIGPMGDVINEALVKKLERGELMTDGVMHGSDMETAFNLIRAKDLVWKYVIDNYLKGLPPSHFDVMYWTNDNTNLPAKMYIYYMREMIFKNKLAEKNALTICDTPIDIGKIDVPVFIVAMQKDYISPPETVFINSRLVGGPVEFILGGSGHVSGVINPPTSKKYGYFLDGKLGEGFEKWQNTAQFHEGSWWTPWSEKLKEKSGKEIPAPVFPGNKTYVALEEAPGSYVKEKC